MGHTSVGFDSEDFKEHNEQVRRQKQEQRDRRVPQLLELQGEGFQIKKLTEFQYRVNDRLDIYPTWAKWHDIKLNKRGTFSGINIKQFIRRFFDGNIS